MNRKVALLALCVFLLCAAVQMSSAQSVRPIVIVQGTPDTTTNPPEVGVAVSVIDPSTGGTVEGLTADDVQIKEAGVDQETMDVSIQDVGLAVVVVVDRGGISARGDRNSVLDRNTARIWDATGLVEDLIDKLAVNGESTDDVIAVVGIGEGGTLDPYADFSHNPVDINKAKNTLGPMKEQAVEGGTPLYEGLDEAIRLLAEHPDAHLSDVLARRRKIVVALSDGIDPNFSDAAREEDIIRKAQEHDISLYTIGVAHRGQQSLSGGGNLERLASQTKGLYVLHNDDASHQQVLNLFDRVVTQRQQYRAVYETRQPKGEYSLQVTVNSETDEVRVVSVLEPPRLALLTPEDGDAFTVPISFDESACLYILTKRERFCYETPTVIPLSVEVQPVDGASRAPVEVRYFANGMLLGASTTPPAYGFEWDVTGIVTPTAQAEVQEFTLSARAEDVYLGQRIESQEVTISITWEAAEQTDCVALEQWVGSSWWILCIVGVLALGMLLLLILLVRTRGKMGQMARRVATSTTGVLKGFTKRLGAAPQKAPGKLIVVQGPGAGREYRLSSAVVKVGRDPQFCDVALIDDYVSNPHFTIHLEQTQFYIVDEGSTNGTRLNGVRIPPGKRMLLRPDAIVEVGNTRMQFKRVGGTTRHLGQEAPQASPPPVDRAPVPERHPVQPQPQPEPEPAPAPPPPPPPVPVRGGATVKLPDEEEPEASGARGGATVKLPDDEEPEASGARGGATVKLPDDEELEAGGARGGETVKLSDEDEPV